MVMIVCWTEICKMVDHSKNWTQWLPAIRQWPNQS